MASTSRSSVVLVALLCLLVFSDALRTRSRISLDNSIREPDNSLLETLSRTTQDEEAEDDSLARFAEAAQRRAAEHSDDANDAVAQAEARFAEAAEAESATSAGESNLGVAGGEEAEADADASDDAPRAAVSEQVEERVEGEEADDENAEEATSVHPTAHRQRFAAATPAPAPAAPAKAKAAPAPAKPAASTPPAKPATQAVVNAAKSAAAASNVKPGYQLATEGFQPPCDLVVSQGLCLFGGQKVILPDATSKGLTAWFKFDEAHPIDSSRFNNHGVSVIPHGMGRGGIGSSARFDGEVWLEVVSSNSLATMLNESSVSFWAFFPPDPENPTNYECPIIHLGRQFETVFDLRYNPVSRRLSANRIRNWVTLKSRAKPAQRQWHHFALTASNKAFKLYINGILDAQADIPAELSPGGVLDKPSFQFFAGSLPWTPASKCRVPVLIDDLKLFNRALRREEIEAESFPSLGAAEPSFVRFGCENCYFDDARKSCPANYHLCYKPELVSGALAIGRKMGWVSVATPIWENDVTENNPEHKGSPGEMRAGFCCAD